MGKKCAGMGGDGQHFGDLHKTLVWSPNSFIVSAE